MKTVEEKAEEYARIGKENPHEAEQAFIAGYNMRDGESQWVKCSERLPDNRTYVLAYTTNGGYTSSCEYKHGVFFKDLDQLNFVTHWQNLPQPPKND